MAQYPSAAGTDSNLWIAKNNLGTALVGAHTNAVTTLTVVSTTGFPATGYVTIDAEAIKYTGTTATTFTGCTRGADGTTATAHADAALVEHNIVADHHNVLKDEIKAIEGDLVGAYGRVTNATSMDTALRSLATYRNWVNVKDYGATGDGTTDDTSAFTTALATGKNVYVPGTTASYKLSTTPNLGTAGQRLFGDGQSSKIVQSGTNTNSTCFTLGAAYCVVENLWLVPNSTVSSSVYGYGVFVNGVDHCIVRNVKVTGHHTGAIGLYNASYCTVTGCDISAAYFTAPTFSTTGTDIYVVYGGGYNVISNNRINNGAGTGIAVQTLAGGIASRGNVITGNTIKSEGVYGIMLYVGASAPVIENTVISNNTIEDITGNVDEPTDHYCFGAGIYIQNAEYTDIIGNLIYNTNQSTTNSVLAPGGIGVTNTSVVNITGNTIRKTNGYMGITVRDPNTAGATTGYATISSNNIYSANTGIEVLQRGRVNIVSNTVDTTTVTGISLANTTTQNQISIIGNQFRNIGTTAISCAYTAGLHIKANDLQLFGAGGNYGISISNASDVTILNNALTNPSSGAYGINITSTVTSGFISGNLVTGCSTGFGVVLNADIRTIGNRVVSNSTNYGGTYAANAATDTEVSYLAGVTSAIQTQLNTKAPSASPTFTGTVTTPVTASRALVTNASSQLTASATTDTQIGYLSTATSDVQTQINAKAPSASPTFTGTVTVPDGTSSSGGVRLTTQNSGLSYVSSGLLHMIVNGTNPAQFGAAGTADDQSKTTFNLISGGGTAKMQVQQYTTTGLTTAAKTIATSNDASLMLVYGSNGSGARFFDVVVTSFYNPTGSVILSHTVSGSPAARTYSASSGATQLTMASGTYTINTILFTLRER